MTFESIMGILFWILILGIAFLVKASTFGTTMTIMSFLGGDCGFAVRLYKMLDEVRRGNKSYEWFVADFNVICNTEANERPVRMTVQQLSERNLVYAKYTIVRFPVEIQIKMDLDLLVKHLYSL